jgi:hypothetical protein
MSPRRIKELTPGERRRAIVHRGRGRGLRPVDHRVLVFAAVIAWEIRRILRADLPQLRAAEAGAVSVAVFLCLYATT